MSVGWCEKCQGYMPGNHPCFQQHHTAAAEQREMEIHVGPPLPGPFPQHGGFVATSAEAVPEGWTISTGDWGPSAPDPLRFRYDPEAQDFVPPTPAAILGEALEHIRRAEELLRAVSHSGNDIAIERALDDLEDGRIRVEGLKRDTERLEGQDAKREGAMPLPRGARRRGGEEMSLVNVPDVRERPSPNCSRRRWDVRVDTVLIHHTGGSSDEGALHWLCLPKGARYKVRDKETGALVEYVHNTPVSAHYVVGTKGDVWQLVDEARKALHAGLGRLPWETCPEYDFNHRSIGIEVVNPGDGVTPFTEAQYRALAFLVPDIVRRLGWDFARMRADGREWMLRQGMGFVSEADRDRKIAYGYVLGHRDVAPERKTDPADNFDWNRIREALAGGHA